MTRPATSALLSYPSLDLRLVGAMFRIGFPPNCAPMHTSKRQL